jgi:hypothetical protein
MTTEAFNPQANTSAIAVTATSQAAVIVLSSSTLNAYITQQLIFTVVGSQPVTVAYDASAPTAVIPTAGSPQKCIVLPADSSQTYSFATGTLFAVIAPATGSTLYITTGAGL